MSDSSLAGVPRWMFALKMAGWHLLLSLLIAAAVAYLVFAIWYPAPLHQLTRGQGIFLILVVVDLICGPLITFIVSTPRKSRRERIVDLSCIALLQLAALGYGLAAVKMARPVIFSFEKDRLAIVTESEIDISTLSMAPEGLQKLPLWGMRKVGIRSARNEKEFFESIHLSFEGIEPSARPGWWLEFQEVLPDLKRAMKPLAELAPLLDEQELILNRAIEHNHLSRNELYYLPLVSKHTQDWLILLGSEGDFLGYANINGFDLAEGKFNK
ncbi:fimb protein [Vandammella animalimorsus]|nr:fimb protein [Vandammella animalimorsus]